MLEKLEFMIALSREQHFGRAAESCGVAQPTLSLGIQSLEEMLEHTARQDGASRFQGFTPEGERVLRWAHRLVGDARAMRQDILGLKDRHRICICALRPFHPQCPWSPALTVPLQTAQSERPIHSAQSHVKHAAQHASTARNRCWRYLPEQRAYRRSELCSDLSRGISVADDLRRTVWPRGSRHVVAGQ